MARLSDLDSTRGNIKVCLVQSPSVQLVLYLQDKLRNQFGVTRNTLIDLSGNAELSMLKTVQNVEPLDSDRWFVLYNYGKKNKVKLADVVSLVESSTTVVYFITVENYKFYKDVKSALKGVDFVYDFYLPYLNRANMSYLYMSIVDKNKQMTHNLYEFVCKNYSSDVDSVMTLFKTLQQGYEVKKQSDITKICGLGSNTIENFVFSLLKDAPETERGLKTTVVNRLKVGYALAEIYNYRSFYNFTLSAVKRILDIKQLRISGAIYKSMKELPSGFDENHLERYQKYIYRINNIPTTRILRLYFHLSKRNWSLGDIAFQQFIYNYYYELLMVEVLPNVHFETEEEAEKKDIEKQEAELRKAELKEQEVDRQHKLNLIQTYGYQMAMKMIKEEQTSGKVVGKRSASAIATEKKSSSKSTSKSKKDTSSSNIGVVSSGTSGVDFNEILARLNSYHKRDE